MLPPPPLQLLPGGAIQFPGRVFLLAVDQRLFTAHCNRDVSPPDPVRMKLSDGSEFLSRSSTFSRRTLYRDYAAMANLFAFSSH